MSLGFLSGGARRAGSLGPWAERVALLATLGALLATSQPPNHILRYEKQVGGLRVELDAERPTATVEVTVTTLELSAFETPTTGNAYVEVSGNVMSSGGEPNSGWVRVLALDAEPISVLTEFSVARSLDFEGNCEDPDAGEPCQARFTVSFAREDQGRGGGTVAVDFRLDFASTASEQGDGGTEGPFEAPWSVEIGGL